MPFDIKKPTVIFKKMSKSYKKKTVSQCKLLRKLLEHVGIYSIPTCTLSVLNAVWWDSRPLWTQMLITVIMLWNVYICKIQIEVRQISVFLWLMGLERWSEMQVTVPLLSSLHTSLSFAWPNYPSVIWHNDLSPSLLREWGCMMRSECDTQREWEREPARGENEIWSLSVAPRFPILPFISCIIPQCMKHRGGGGGGHARSYGPCFCTGSGS